MSVTRSHVKVVKFASRSSFGGDTVRLLLLRVVRRSRWGAAMPRNESPSQRINRSRAFTMLTMAEAQSKAIKMDHRWDMI